MKRLALLFVASAVCSPLLAQSFDAFRLSGLAGKSQKTWHGQADVQALNVELGHSLSPRTTVGLVVAPINVWQPRSWFGDQYGDGNETVRALSASLLIRRSFRVHSQVIPYLEGSTGPMYAEKSVPASTSRFNFVTQAGLGLTFNGQGRYPFFAAYRFLHISNGGYSPRNPGLNIGAIVAGVQLRSARLPRR